MMLTHDRIWSALDRLAERYGLTPSGLARKAGLDPTTFNRSKRSDYPMSGRTKWPSTLSVSKVLTATGASLEEFTRLIDPKVARARAMIPVIGMRKARLGRSWNDGWPIDGPDWDEVALAPAGEKMFAIRVDGRDLEPVFRAGDVVILSPTASMREGDRVMIRMRSGDIVAKKIVGHDRTTFRIRALAEEHADRAVPKHEISWIARVMAVQIPEPTEGNTNA